MIASFALIPCINLNVMKQAMAATPPGDERAQRAAAWRESAKWFNEQVDELPKRFAPFLKIRG
jgi:hypothetical protein